MAVFLLPQWCVVYSPQDLLVDDLHVHIYVELEVFAHENRTLVTAKDSQTNEHHRPRGFTNYPKLCAQARQTMSRCTVQKGDREFLESKSGAWLIVHTCSLLWLFGILSAIWWCHHRHRQMPLQVQMSRYGDVRARSGYQILRCTICESYWYAFNIFNIIEFSEWKVCMN